MCPAGQDPGSGDSLVYPVFYLASPGKHQLPVLSNTGVPTSWLLAVQTEQTGSANHLPLPRAPRGKSSHPRQRDLPSKGPAGTCPDKSSLCFCAPSQRTASPEAGLPQDGYGEAGVLPAVGTRKAAVPGAGRKRLGGLGPEQLNIKVFAQNTQRVPLP